ncbi:hypothetical protein UCMB321_1280 [Pseudomonas batumici]|uniref:Uncharacterized protein n=1 Tax=Pseudomonas batumici TaxID=226910 RepID=A0A0C2IJ59_9PSED|nr:hypothetical protein UCMB321_1280 [Pseudomonas batumici]
MLRRLTGSRVHHGDEGLQAERIIDARQKTARNLVAQG